MNKPLPSRRHPGKPQGSDTVPAWLTPGEFVMNAEAARMFSSEIQAMNDRGVQYLRVLLSLYLQYHLLVMLMLKVEWQDL